MKNFGKTGHLSLMEWDIYLSTFIKKRNALELIITENKTGTFAATQVKMQEILRWWRKYRIVFCAMAKNAGVNGKKAEFYVYYRPKSKFSFSVLVPNCTRVVPSARKNERRSAGLPIGGKKNK